MQKVYIPIMQKPPEEQEWDMALWCWADWYGHTAASILTLPFREGSNFRWVEYDPVYERMFKDMARTVDPVIQEGKIRKLVEHIYDRAYVLFIYSPLLLYEVNKEVEFVSYMNAQLRFKETSVTENHWSLRGKNN
jgi:hypothetical protein